MPHFSWITGDAAPPTPASIAVGRAITTATANNLAMASAPQPVPARSGGGRGGAGTIPHRERSTSAPNVCINLVNPGILAAAGGCGGAELIPSEVQYNNHAAVAYY